jgi:hypothetical protein
MSLATAGIGGGGVMGGGMQAYNMPAPMPTHASGELKHTVYSRLVCLVSQPLFTYVCKYIYICVCECVCVCMCVFAQCSL